jgi:hypothetical protein
MFLSRFFPRHNRPARPFRPAIVLLEDRTVPSATVVPGPATHLQVTVRDAVQSGQSFDVLVKAEDASNRPAGSFTDTVKLSLGTADSKATLPAAYTFTSTDHGVHDFKVTLVATGHQTTIATDTTTGSAVAAGSAATTVNPVPVATTVVVRTPEQTVTGVIAPVTVEVLDQSGHELHNFTGTVTFTSSDAAATASATRKGTQTPLSTFSYTFDADDHGEHTSSFLFGTGSTGGTKTTVTAKVTSGSTSLTGSGSVTVYPPTTVTHFGVFALPHAINGLATPVLVEALNAANQVVTGYTGTVQFKSSDSAPAASATYGGTATLLANFSYQFTTGTGKDNGQHTFWLTFGTVGHQTLTVSNGSLTRSIPIGVLPALRFSSSQHWMI